MLWSGCSELRRTNEIYRLVPESVAKANVTVKRPLQRKVECVTHASPSDLYLQSWPLGTTKSVAYQRRPPPMGAELEPE